MTDAGRRTRLKWEGPPRSDSIQGVEGAMGVDDGRDPHPATPRAITMPRTSSRLRAITIPRERNAFAAGGIRKWTTRIIRARSGTLLDWIAR
jgi:hypothetical protein